MVAISPGSIFITLSFKINYNSGHNILELYDVLVRVQFTTSKMKFDILRNKLGLWVVSQVTEQQKVVGQSFAFNEQIDSSQMHIIFLLNEEVEARDIPGFMATSNSIRRKLFFQGKIFYWGRSHSKHTFHKDCPSEQGDK